MIVLQSSTIVAERPVAFRKDIITWLENIAKELVHLDLPAAAPVGAAVGSGPRMSDRPRIFTDETLRGM